MIHGSRRIYGPSLSLGLIVPTGTVLYIARRKSGELRLLQLFGCKVPVPPSRQSLWELQSALLGIIRYYQPVPSSHGTSINNVSKTVSSAFAPIDVLRSGRNRIRSLIYLRHTLVFGTSGISGYQRPSAGGRKVQLQTRCGHEATLQ